MSKVLFALAASMCVAYAAIAIAPLEDKPIKFKDKEGCYVSDLDVVIPFGQRAPSNTSCLEYICSTNYVQIATCGAVVKSRCCKTVVDKSLPYPGCCPKC